MKNKEKKRSVLCSHNFALTSLRTPTMLGLLRLRRAGFLPSPPPTTGTSLSFFTPFSSASTSASQPPVGIFWDLDNKPPNSIPPYDAAVRLRLAASSFGPLRLSLAFANHHAFRHLPSPVRSARALRRSLDRLEDSGLLSPSVPYLCRVCGRNFYNHSKFLHHFKQIHEREHSKRLHRIDSARGARKVRLAAKLALKMDKFKKSAAEVLIPKIGYGLADELKRAGFRVRMVEDKPEAADRALREQMVDEMDRGRIGCFVLVSDDSGFAGVLREARMRCLKTVVVGDERDGALKRSADVGFSWKDVASGKARKEAGSAVGRWKDRELLERLEWRYRPEDGEESECSEFDDGDDSDGNLGLVRKGGSQPWWKLDLQSEDSVGRSS